MAEALTAFLSIQNPLGDETEDAIQEAFDDLEVSLGGVGELVGWDADADGVQLHLLADAPERVIALVVGTLVVGGALVGGLVVSGVWGTLAVDGGESIGLLPPGVVPSPIISALDRAAVECEASALDVERSGVELSERIPAAEGARTVSNVIS